MNTHQKMKAVGAYQYLPISNPESLIDLHLDKPEPTGRDLLVRVKAISVNPADVGVRETHNYEAESPKILGWDAAGIVEQVGPDCQLFKPGDKVYYAGSVSRPGSNSEFHLVDERIVGNMPRSLDFAAAAALPLTSITAWEGLWTRFGNPGLRLHYGCPFLPVASCPFLRSRQLYSVPARRQPPAFAGQTCPSLFLF